MWKREDADRTQSSVSGSGDRVGTVAIQKPAAPPTGSTSNQMGREVVNIGKSVIIKGELTGSEDLTIEGKVDGQIELREHILTIGPNGKIKAQVFAKSIIVMGNVVGNISASDKINIRENGNVEGNISAPVVSISEGAHFRGNIDMQRPKASPSAQPRTNPADHKPRTENAGAAKRVAAPAQGSTARPTRAAH